MTEAAVRTCELSIECMRAGNQLYNIDAGIRGLIANNLPLEFVKPRTALMSEGAPTEQTLHPNITKAPSVRPALQTLLKALHGSLRQPEATAAVAK